MKTLLALFLVLLCIQFTLCAETFFVPSNHETIQKAINAATNGDTILVASGIYKENINFHGKAVTVESSDGPISTVIDGGFSTQPDKGSVISFINGEKSDSILRGFTIYNGTGYLDNYNKYVGGGIYCFQSSPSIFFNIIINNFADSGGGIYCQGPKCNPIIVNCLISNNTIDPGYIAGGICCFESSALIKGCTISNHKNGCGVGIWSAGTPLIYNNIITGNDNRHSGGGIACSNSPAPIIQNNEITYNRAMDGGGISIKNGVIINNNISFNIAKYMIGGGICAGNGGGIDLKGGDVKIANNLLSNNIAMCHGGGIYALKARMANNIICNNIAGGGNMMKACGGGIYINNDVEYVFKNNIIYNNESYDYGGGIYCNQFSNSFIKNTTIAHNHAYKGKGVYGQDGSSISVVNSILWNDILDDVFMETGIPNISYSNTMSTLPGAGNISANPQFVEPVNDDYHLQYFSPCRNAGDNSWVVGPYDFEGNPRIAFGPVDMGADEFYTHLYYTGNASPGDNITGKLIGLPRTTPVGLFFGSGIMEPSIPTMWGQFHLQSPLLLLPLPTFPSNGVLELPATVPLSPSAPYDIPMQALIGLNADSLTNVCLVEVR